MKQYIIQDPQGLGFWSETRGTFGGILFVSYFNDENFAWEKAKELAKTHNTTLTVIPVVR